MHLLCWSVQCLAYCFRTVSSFEFTFATNFWCLGLNQSLKSSIVRATNSLNGKNKSKNATLIAAKVTYTTYSNIYNISFWSFSCGASSSLAGPVQLTPCLLAVRNWNNRRRVELIQQKKWNLTLVIVFWPFQAFSLLPWNTERWWGPTGKALQSGKSTVTYNQKKLDIILHMCMDCWCCSCIPVYLKRLAFLRLQLPLSSDVLIARRTMCGRSVCYTWIL